MSCRPSSGDIASVVINLRGGTSIAYFPKREQVRVQRVTEDGYRMVDAEIPVEDFIKVCMDLIKSKENV
jgi:hypothetical protein